MKFNNIDETIESFLKKRGNKQFNDGTYKPKLIKFKKYLIYHKNLEQRNDFETILKEISPSDIEVSLKYYIWTSKSNARQVKAKVNLATYLTVINEYFRYLQNNNIPNEKLLAWFDLEVNNEKVLNIVVERVSAEEQLRDKRGMEPLNQNEIDMLIRVCNNQINNFTESQIKGKKYTAYRYFVSSLICKLILETGIKYKVVGTIKRDDFDINKGLLILHGKYSIKLSVLLTEQLKKYIDIREHIESKKKDHMLFVHVNDLLNPKINNYVSTFLMKIGRADTTGIGKAKIMHLMKEGIPEIIIKEMTSYEASVINNCRDRVQNYKEDYTCINQFINNVMTVG